MFSGLRLNLASKTNWKSLNIPRDTNGMRNKETMFGFPIPSFENKNDAPNKTKVYSSTLITRVPLSVRASILYMNRNAMESPNATNKISTLVKFIVEIINYTITVSYSQTNWNQWANNRNSGCWRYQQYGCCRCSSVWCTLGRSRSWARFGTRYVNAKKRQQAERMI